MFTGQEMVLHIKNNVSMLIWKIIAIILFTSLLQEILLSQNTSSNEEVTFILFVLR